MPNSTNEKKSRVLEVDVEKVQCLSDRREPLEKCSLCVHSVKFRESGTWKPSPARAYCVLSRNTGKVDLKAVDAVECDDKKGEVYRRVVYKCTRFTRW